MSSKNKIFLIKKVARPGWEDFIVDDFIAVFSSEEKAQLFALKKDQESKSCNHFIIKMNVDEKE